MLSRGWVLQEWLLSRRVVYFTPAGIIVECATGGPRNQLGENILDNESGWYRFLNAAYRKVDNWNYNGRRERWLDLWTREQTTTKIAFRFEPHLLPDLWYRIAQSYSSLALTMPGQDRAVALAGIAQEFRHVLKHEAQRRGGTIPIPTVGCGPEYAAGIWLRELHHGLLWTANPAPSMLSIARIDGIPTWSWMSIISGVIWHDTDARQLWKRRAKPVAEIRQISNQAGASLDFLPIKQIAISGLTNEPAVGFDTTNQFARIILRSKVLSVLVREELCTDTDTEHAKALMGPDDVVNTTLWRKVCSSENPTEIIGWASLEDPRYADESLYYGGLPLSALVISTQVRATGHGFGYLMPWMEVYLVLFVLRTSGNRVERIGTGRICGGDVVSGFRNASEQDFELV